MNYIAFCIMAIVVLIPGVALMKSGDRRIANYDVIGSEERRRSATPYYVGGVLWIAVVYVIWLAASIGWVIS